MNSQATQGIETRAIDESIRHGLDAISRAEATLADIWSDVTGYGNPGVGETMAMPPGLISQADLLAGKIENLGGELNRLRASITAPNVKSLGAAAPYADAVNHSRNFG